MLELNHIHKYYNAGTVNEMCLFHDFSLSIEDGQFVSVVGSNGSGKTSMLNLICGSIPLDAGQIKIGNEEITGMPEFKRQKRIGSTDEKYLRRAEELLFGELAVALEISMDDVPAFIEQRLGSLAAALE